MGLSVFVESRYTKGMDFVIEFNSDAFKHGVDEADIKKAFDTAIYDGLLDEPGDDDARDKVTQRVPCTDFAFKRERSSAARGARHGSAKMSVTFFTLL
jgi:hypothetical protein